MIQDLYNFLKNFPKFLMKAVNKCQISRIYRATKEILEK